MSPRARPPAPEGRGEKAAYGRPVLSRHFLRGPHDGAQDTDVGPAFAQVSCKRLPDLVFSRSLCCCEECGGLHDHAIDAVAALSCLFVDECLLNRMRLLGRTETLQGHDLGVGHGRDRHDAASQRLAVIVHRAGAALCQAATEMHAVQAKLVAQCVQQRHAGIVNLQGDGLAIDGQFDGGGHDPDEPLVEVLRNALESIEAGAHFSEVRYSPERLVEYLGHRYANSAQILALWMLEGTPSCRRGFPRSCSISAALADG